MPPTIASQTIGPYWHLIADNSWADLTRFGARQAYPDHTCINLIGAVTDGDAAPVTDACVEIWQSDPTSSESFPGFGRCGTDRNGGFRFMTLKPGPVPGRGNVQQAPHIALCIFARGLMRGLVTRAYFDNEPLNTTDPLLISIADPTRRATLIARPEARDTWRLDIHLQGSHETVFFEI
jgi:protocatechuate 3,4-dioxygenase, alpha subunit